MMEDGKSQSMPNKCCFNLYPVLGLIIAILFTVLDSTQNRYHDKASNIADLEHVWVSEIWKTELTFF